MKNIFWMQSGNFKVWSRGNGNFQVREGNRVLSRHTTLWDAEQAARKLNTAVWDRIAAEDAAWKKTEAEKETEDFVQDAVDHFRRARNSMRRNSR